MGKSKLKLTRTEQTKLSVTGILDDVNTVSYLDENNNVQTANIDSLLDLFVGKEINLLVSEKVDDDISV